VLSAFASLPAIFCSFSTIPVIHQFSLAPKLSGNHSPSHLLALTLFVAVTVTAYGHSPTVIVTAYGHSPWPWVRDCDSLRSQSYTSDSSTWSGGLGLGTLHVGELWTGRRNSRDTTGEGCKLFCNSCCNKLSVTVTVTVWRSWSSQSSRTGSA
jgi:hypothetical protein